MRIQAIVAAVTLLSAALVSAADTRSACELLPASLVRSITDRTVQIDPKHSRTDDAGRSVCAYVGDRTAFTLSVLSLETETAARSAFARELVQSLGSDGASAQPLRGVGVEARLRVSKHAHSGTLVARHGSVVFILRGAADQETLVSLARSVVAQLERQKSQ